MFKMTNDKQTVEILEGKTPFVIVSKEAISKMKVYIDECSNEVGWLGTAFRLEGGFYIDDVFLFDQEVHSTTTEITPEGLMKFGEEILSKEGGIDLWNSIKVWGHSHVNMSTFASGQDNSQMKVFTDCGHDFFLRIIANKKGEMRIDIYDYDAGLIYNFSNWSISKTKEELEVEDAIRLLKARIEVLEKDLKDKVNVVTDEKKEEIKKEIKEKVKPKVTYYNSSKNGVISSSPTNITKYVDYKKKKEREEKEKEDNPTAEDIYGIDSWTLSELSLANNFKDGLDILELYGYGEDYTDKQIEDLIYIAKNRYREIDIEYGIPVK